MVHDSWHRKWKNPRLAFDIIARLPAIFFGLYRARQNVWRPGPHPHYRLTPPVRQPHCSSSIGSGMRLLGHSKEPLARSHAPQQEVTAEGWSSTFFRFVMVFPVVS